MHMLGEPRTMQADPRYGDVVDEVRAFLAERLALAVREGIARGAHHARPRHRLRQDGRAQPRAARRLDELTALGRPLVVGHLAQELPRPAARPAPEGCGGPIEASRRLPGRSPPTCSRSSAARASSASTTWRRCATRWRWRLLRWAGDGRRRGDGDGLRGARRREAETQTTIARRPSSRSPSRSPACRCTPTTASARPSARSASGWCSTCAWTSAKPMRR